MSVAFIVGLIDKGQKLKVDKGLKFIDTHLVPVALRLKA